MSLICRDCFKSIDRFFTSSVDLSALLGFPPFRSFDESILLFTWSFVLLFVRALGFAWSLPIPSVHCDDFGLIFKSIHYSPHWSPSWTCLGSSSLRSSLCSLNDSALTFSSNLARLELRSNSNFLTRLGKDFAMAVWPFSNITRIENFTTKAPFLEKKMRCEPPEIGPHSLPPHLLFSIHFHVGWNCSTTWVGNKTSKDAEIVATERRRRWYFKIGQKLAETF